MAKKKHTKPLGPEELEQQSGEELPDREVMSILPIPDLTGPSTLPPILPAGEPSAEEPG
jgi:hypothetical protein